MLREKKTQIVDVLADQLSQSAIIISTNYQGLVAKQMEELRSTLRKANIEYHVVKNTLLHRAADKAGKPQIMAIVEGPVALAFGQDDVAAARVLNQYVKSGASSLEIRGALLGERVLRPEEVVGLASLPSREVLVARLIGQLQAPVGALHNVLNSPLRGLLYVLQSRMQTTSTG